MYLLLPYSTWTKDAIPAPQLQIYLQSTDIEAPWRFLRRSLASSLWPVAISRSVVKTPLSCLDHEFRAIKTENGGLSEVDRCLLVPHILTSRIICPTLFKQSSLYLCSPFPSDSLRTLHFSVPYIMSPRCPGVETRSMYLAVPYNFYHFSSLELRDTP